MKKDFFRTTTVSLMISILGLLSGVMISRILGPEGRGILTVLTFWPGILAAVGVLSIQDSATFLIGEKSEPNTVKSVEASVFWLAVVLSGLTALISLFLLPLLLKNWFQGYAFYIFLSLLVIPIHIISKSLLGIDLGHQRFGKYNSARFSLSVSYVVILGAFIVIGIRDVRCVYIAYLVSYSMPFLVRIFSYRDLLSIKPNVVQMLTIAKKGIRYHVTNVLYIFTSQIDLLIIIYLLKPSAIGLYTVARTLTAAVAALVGNTYQTLIFPLAMRVKDERGRIDFIVTNLQLSLITLGLLLSVLSISAQFIIPLLFGQAFAASSPVTAILCVAFLFTTQKDISIRALRALGDYKIGIGVECFFGVVYAISLGVISWFGIISLQTVAGILSLASLLSYVLFLIMIMKSYGLTLGQITDIRIVSGMVRDTVRLRRKG